MTTPEHDRTPDKRWVLPIFAAFASDDRSWPPAGPLTGEEVFETADDVMPDMMKRLKELRLEKPITPVLMMLINDGFIDRDPDTLLLNLTGQSQEDYEKAMSLLPNTTTAGSTELNFRSAPIALPAGPLGEEYMM